MKISVLYYSRSGNTKKMAGEIVEGVGLVDGAEAKAFAIDVIDTDYLKESAAVIIGTPIYQADMASALRAWFEEKGASRMMVGKLGGAFATELYVYGGGESGIRSILAHMLVCGMHVYSSGRAFGEPLIHLGPVALANKLDESIDIFREYGRRMALKAVELYGTK